MKTTFFLLLSIFSTGAFAGNYQLKYSDVFVSCNFMHEDEYSVSSITNSIRAMLETKLDGDRACNATFNQLHSEMMNIDQLLSKDVDKKTAEEIYHETYSKYLQDLTQESLTLDRTIPGENTRYQGLTAQIDSLKLSLLNNQFSLQLNKESLRSDKSTNFRRDLYNYASGMFNALNQAPTQCIDKLGGWEQMLPAVLKVGGMVGTFMGPAGPVIGAGFTAASQLAILLQNRDLRRAISEIDRRKNEAILACTYQSLQTTACELARADKFVSNQQKINDIIFNRFPEGQNGEYERYYKSLNLLPRVYDILQSIGKMGSALTLDLRLMSQYIASIRVDPFDPEIKPPAESSEDLEIKRWLLKMKTRGFEVNDVNMRDGTIYTVREQLKLVKTQIEQAKSTIQAVDMILKENRSFVDLHSELMKKGINVAQEIRFLDNFLKKISTRESFPKQYLGVFAAAEKMLAALNDFLAISYEDTGSLEKFEEDINIKGKALFAEMSRGSVAQIDAQSILMIPEIAFQRITRPFESIEQYYLNEDIANRESSEHESFSEFVIYRSLQIKVANDYQLLTGSKKAMRLEQYETARRSFEKGFKKDILKMIKNAVRAKSDVLTSFEGKTAAHMCALFAGFLEKEAPRYYKYCKKTYKKLELLNVLDGFNKKKDMEIEYDKPCFYNDYKREENGQRILFERLKDYGNKDLHSFK